MRRRTAAVCLSVALTGSMLGAAVPAAADHTDPKAPLTPVEAQPGEPALATGEGTWKFIANLGPFQGTDLEFFSRNGATYVSAGTLGQAPNGTPGFIGQRVVQLTDVRGEMLEEPKIVADHGSSRCSINSSATGLQHDVQAVPLKQTELLIDTTDA